MNSVIAMKLKYQTQIVSIKFIGTYKKVTIYLLWKNIDLTRRFLAFASLGSNVFGF